MTNSSSLDYWQSAAAVVESSNDAIICTDLIGTITSWNKAAKTIFGYRPEEIIVQPVFLLAAPGREDEMPIILDQIIRGERIQHYETVRCHKEGRQIAIRYRSPRSALSAAGSSAPRRSPGISPSARRPKPNCTA